MKTNLLIPLALICCLTALPLACGAEAHPPATPVADEPARPADLWAGLKECVYDQRETLFAGLPTLAARIEAQIAELATKRATLDATNTSTQAWDFAMQEMERARTTLLSTSADLTKADRDTWNQLKDKVGLAWVRTQDAYTKVKASTTN